MVQVCDPSTWEMKAVESRVQPGLIETLFKRQSTKTKQKTTTTKNQNQNQNQTKNKNQTNKKPKRPTQS